MLYIKNAALKLLKYKSLKILSLKILCFYQKYNILLNKFKSFLKNAALKLLKYKKFIY